MKKQMVLCVMCLLSCSISAQETSSDFESCADGGGVVIVGAVNTQKYCMSHAIMNWWNAVAWCDAMGKKLVPFNQEECDFISTGIHKLCPNFFETESPYGYRVWTSTPAGNDIAYRIGINHEHYDTHARGDVGQSAGSISRALCKM